MLRIFGQLVPFGLVRLIRHGQGFFYGVSVSKSEFEGIVGQPYPFCPRGHGHCFSTKRQQAIVSLVPPLFFWGGPFAIARLVVSIIISSFYLVLRRWLRPHILKKCLKRIKPSIANLDSPPSIVGVTICRDVVATRFHGKPACVFGSGGFRSRPSAMNTCLSTICGAFLFAETPTTICPIRGQVSSSNNAKISTSAKAFPKVAIPSLASVVNNGQAAVFIAGNVFESTMCWFTIKFCHLATSIAGDIEEA